ncbi:MAG: trigger factor [Prevotella sp.]|jgi:trigger factor|nr:trigger factor [Prevotella sp.]
MNTSITTVDSVNAIIQITIEKADYQEKVEKALKNFRQKANVPGFRPGHVPASLVKKMYGKSILAEEVNNIVGESLYGYIKENNLNVLGEPLPNEEKQQPIDFEAESGYDFFFDVALAPEIKVSLTKRDKINYYKVAIDEELVDKQIASYKANYGKYETIEGNPVETDLLKGEIRELENELPKENGIFVENGVLMPSYIKDETEKSKFVGVKVGDTVIINPGKAYDGHEAEIASFLHIQKNEVESIAPEFSFTIKEITRYQEAEINQELFDKVFGEGTVASVEEFRQKVKESIAAQFVPDSDYKFLLDARILLDKKAGQVEFPDAFLKRWLLVSGKDKTVESVEADYPKIVEDLKFHLIKEQIVKDHNLNVEEADIKEVAKSATRAQLAQYGMMNLPEDIVENYAAEMLKNKDTVRNLLDRAMEAKIAGYLKMALGVTEKEISLDEFKKLFAEA